MTGDARPTAAAETAGPGGRWARGLGWLSAGLGLPLVAVPGHTLRLLGLDDSAAARALARFVGVRELSQAVGLVRGRHPAGWMWSRAIGDALDLAAIGYLGGRAERRSPAAVALALGLTATDLLAAVRVTRAARTHGRIIRAGASVTVNRSTTDAYRFWHDFENLPRFMAHLRSVRIIRPGVTRWTANAPAGRRMEWDAEVVADRPDRVIAWRSLPGARVPNSGSVRFTPAPGGRGTEVRVELTYAPPGGRLGRAVARLFGEEPAQQIRDDLRRFKQVLETGEVVRSDGSPSGVSVHRQALQRPARPRVSTLAGER
ncbi:MAG TPA: SRPBCC family protein [Micromonosporaceae bacterium]